jgi:pimeloyl-ACP methyl ester carboxylesterase
MATFVFVSGAWHGAWCWERVVPLLERLGHRTITDDLPGMGADNTPLRDITLPLWARFIADIALAQDEPVVLVGHSRGGIVISQAAEYAPDAIATTVYVSGVLVPNGLRLADVIKRAVRATPISEARHFSPDGVSMTLSSEVVAPYFYNTSEPRWAERAALMLTPEPLSPSGAVLDLSEARYGRVPRAYIHCLQDHPLPIEFQRLMQDGQPCWRVASIDSDHSPFYSAPEQLAAELDTIAGLASTAKNR